MADSVGEVMGESRPVRHRIRSGVVVAATLCVAVLAGCAARPPLPDVGNQSPVDRSGYRVLAGVEQLYVLGALTGDAIEVRDGTDVVGGGTADRLGSLAVRGLHQGRTYTVLNVTSGDSRPARILRADEHPPQSFYDSTVMHEGLNYIPMRDGITLAATVRPPLGLSLADGPFPTVIEYSGYQVAAPGDPLLNKLGGLFGLPRDPMAPGGETDVGSLLVRLAGFATVSVQIRGSGCSGGESDLFDLPTNLDGYDAIETVAAQPWVSNGIVGMVGISFSGFSQIGVAATHPPHLAAIAPMSFTGNLYEVAHPGGIFNDGFGSTWMAERVANARPAPDPGALPYANGLVATDAQCRENQKLRLQTRDGNDLIRSNELFTDIYRRRDFPGWMRQIRVPTFASLQFDDEETSSYAIQSVSGLLGANDRVFLNLSSGHHRDAVTPDTITEYFEFLDIYVARRPPEPKLLVNLVSDIIFGTGSAVPRFPDTVFMPLEAARARVEARPRVRLLTELPAGSAEGHNPGARWDVRVPTYPVPGSTEQTWYLGPQGALTSVPPPVGAAASYRPDVVGRRHDPGPAVVDDPERFVWTPVAADASLGFVTAPLDQDVVVVGPVGARIALSSSAADTDLAVTVTEVRPDGQEMLVGTGVQRASMRHVDADRTTATRPALTFDRVEPLRGAGAVDVVPVQVMPMSHVFRAGSRIRIVVAGVNGDRERWTFDSVDPADRSTVDTVHLGGATPSSVTFTVAPLGPAPAERLPCPAAAKPCRPWIPAGNGG
ncbi:MAG TPA: CocE/NonD family hydrolase [Microthrixaceae bacterium]|nr:CocE/NonD family hydrolase [Microthrixaceae bacterium]